MGMGYLLTATPVKCRGRSGAYHIAGVSLTLDVGYLLTAAPVLLSCHSSCEKKRSEKQGRKGMHVNAKFQRIARRDRKAFLSDQCKEIEENNRTGKMRDLFKKIRDTKGTFHARMGTIKDRNGMDLTEAQDIKKRGQEYTEELYKKDLHDPDDHDGVITHLEPNILQCEVKWALGSITMNKASGGDRFQLRYFKS